MLVAWQAVGRSQRWYLWFISDHSSKKPVDAASLSLPLCPTHRLSIGLPHAPWHIGTQWTDRVCGATRALAPNRPPAWVASQERSFSEVKHTLLFALSIYSGTPTAVFFRILKLFAANSVQP